MGPSSSGGVGAIIAQLAVNPAPPPIRSQLGRVSTMPDVPDTFSSVPLLSALLERRSRRFATGLRLNGGPLAFQSRRAPTPLGIQEEAALAFAASGVTGPVLSELPFETGDLPDAGGGRTVASGDAMHLATVFVVNDEGAW